MSAHLRFAEWDLLIRTLVINGKARAGAPAGNIGIPAVDLP
ncbi:MAG TPA: hypothetical protein VFI54_06110 [Solirubrobacteraceae bacterium]|nr:hypothetical protein [Solirubrobacteraceae bacterium]